MLVINSVKNVSLENITFEKNSLVLVKQTTRENEKINSIDTNIKYIEVCELKDTKDLTIIQSLLRFTLAETRVHDNFVKEFTDTGIKNKKLLNQFFSSNTIFRTDSEGKISKALISEIPLKNTALNIKDRHSLMSCKPENLKAAIYQHAKAVLAQCSYVSAVASEAEKILQAEQNGTLKVQKTKKVVAEVVE